MSLALPIFKVSGLQPDAAASHPTPPGAPASANVPGRLFDSHGRAIRDLRLSITDRCNFRCVYCMDPDFRYMPKQQLLSLEEYLRLVRACLSLGIEKVRITGGEPTLYPQLDALIRELGRMNIRDLAMTTNGSLLDKQPVHQWRRDGLRRITLSLDSLRPDRVQAITRTASTADSVIRAIRIAHEAGFAPVKVNAVIMRGVNDDEVADFADFALEHGVDMRLIEFMPLDSSHAWDRTQVVGADEMLARIRERHALVAVADDDPSSTSMNFTFGGGSTTAGANPARIGIIAPVTRPFCGACSRLRITADGKIRPCLFSLTEWDIKPLLRAGRQPAADNGSGAGTVHGGDAAAASDEVLREFIINAVWTKQAGHGIGSTQFVQPARTMSAIGG